VAGEEPGDDHLRAALDGLLAGQEELTRVLLGTARDDVGGDGPSGTGWEQGGAAATPSRERRPPGPGPTPDRAHASHAQPRGTSVSRVASGRQQNRKGV
ncbi:hypothetical protein, partial [Acinetobacter baumannii]|uniref:hypothetical protein n=1 Tax=Acinetobacter baumannii TaxID=470 RepID=UPI0018E0C538